MCVPAEQKSVLTHLAHALWTKNEEALTKEQRVIEGEFDETQNKTWKGTERKERAVTEKKGVYYSCAKSQQQRRGEIEREIDHNTLKKRRLGQDGG